MLKKVCSEMTAIAVKSKTKRDRWGRLETEYESDIPYGKYQIGTPTRSRVFVHKDTGIRAPNVDWDYTEEEALELLKCNDDPYYFMSYITIVSGELKNGVSEKRQPFTPRPYQKRMIDSIVNHRFTSVLAPRQCGKTTAIGAIALWYAIFNKDYKIQVLAHKASAAKDILARTKLAYLEMPYWMKPGIKAWGKGYVEFDNGSKIVADATSESSGRSGSFDMLILEEFAFVDEFLADEFYASVYPTISSFPSSKLMIVSTPNGIGNMFHSIHTKARRKLNNYNPVEIAWDEIPGRNHRYKQETIADIGELKWYQEYECRFLGSKATLIDGKVIENMVPTDPVVLEEKYSGDFRVYKKPEPLHTYAIGVDVADGVGGDSSVIKVVDITDKRTTEEVASWSANRVGTEDLPTIINEIGLFYNSAHVLCEVNNMGTSVVKDLHEQFEYESLVKYGTLASTRHGVSLNRASKHAILQHFKKMVETGRHVVNDKDTISQLGVYVRSITGSYGAEGKSHDDHVSASLLAVMAVHRDILEKLDFVEDTKDSSKQMADKIEKKKKRITGIQDYYSDEPNGEQDDDMGLPDIYSNEEE
jgi:Terminase RNaseH-like domain/Terminase large subunit, T4likevirus-type, N-terminal